MWILDLLRGGEVQIKEVDSQNNLTENLSNNSENNEEKTDEEEEENNLTNNEIIKNHYRRHYKKYVCGIVVLSGGYLFYRSR